MENSKVVLLPCPGYDQEEVYQTLQQGLSLLGGLQHFVSPEEHILLKPNLLKNASPEKAVTTHPAVFGAMARCLSEAGYSHLTYGDSPGPGVDLQTAARDSGLVPQAEKYGVALGDFSGAEFREYPQGKTAKRFPLSHEVARADAIISLCKMKTHALENITGAVKNQYGCIYGANKAAGHAKYPNSRIFADMLADLDQCLGVRLFVMDGILAMEGNGPSSGTPKHMGLLLLSADPVALDALFARLVYLDPAHVPTCVSGAKCGLGAMDFAHITILTPQGEITVEEAVEKYGDPTFDVKRDNIRFWKLRKLLPAAKKKYHDRPVVDAARCVGCGICQKACPAQAVQAGGGSKAVYDYRKCIRCYCCQEMCPAGAISRENK